MSGVESVGANYYNAQTKNGNPYKKTKACRKMGFWVPVAVTGGSAVVAGGVLTKAAKTTGFKNVVKEFLTNTGAVLFKSSGKMLKYGAIGFAVGLVLDKIINASRRKNADKPIILK